MGEGFKLIKGLLVLVAKEDVDGLALWCHGSAHKVSSVLLYYLVARVLSPLISVQDLSLRTYFLSQLPFAHHLKVCIFQFFVCHCCPIAVVAKFIHRGHFGRYISQS